MIAAPLSTVSRLFSHRALRLALYAVIGVLQTVWSWRKWPDALVDFGRELYVPWRIAEGETLYRDVASLFGPLSPYWNGLLFRVFGVSFTTLIIANLVLLALLVWMLDDFFERTFEAATAALATSAFLLVFAFGQYTNIGNYNYVAPYAHEAVHGFILAIAVLFLLGRALTVGTSPPIAGAGFCFGLVHLTKPEPALAITAAMALYFALLYREQGRIGRELRLFLGFAAIPLLIAFALFSSAFASGDALKATLGAWQPVFSQASGGDFYLKGMGFDAPLNNARAAFFGAAVFAVLVTVAVLLDGFAQRRPRFGRPLAVIVGIAIVVGLTQRAVFRPWIQVGRPLPIIVAVILFVALWMLLQAPLAAEARRRQVLLVTWTAFAGVLLMKMLLQARLYNYGFTLAVPAVLLVIAILYSSLPERMRRVGKGGTVLRGLALCLTVAFVTTYWLWSDRTYATKNHDIGSEGDRIIVEDPDLTDRSSLLAMTLGAIEEILPPDTTMAVFPEGVMLNYLSRHPASTPYVNYMPGELATFGEESIVAAHEATPPDFVVLMHKNTREHGLGQFGASPEFGGHIMDWVRRNYEVVWAIGPEPFTGTKFGVRILQRRTRQAQP